MIRWLVFLYLLTGLCSTGCAHKFNRSSSEHDAQEDRFAWKIGRTAAAEQHSSETASSDRKVTGRTVVRQPDGTVIDTSWVDEAVSRYQAQADASAHSASTAAAEGEHHRQHDAAAKAAGSTSWWPPWWVWALAGAVLFVLFWLLRWRARRIRLI